MPQNKEEVETTSYLIPKSYFDKIKSVPFIQAEQEKDRSVRVRLTSTDKRISDRDRALFSEAFQLLEDSKQFYDSNEKESLGLLLAQSLKSSQNRDLGGKWWLLFIVSSAIITGLIGGWSLVLALELTLCLVYVADIVIIGIFTQDQPDRNQSVSVKWILVISDVTTAVIIGWAGCQIALAYTLITAAFIAFRTFIRKVGWTEDQLDRNALVSKINELKKITSEDKKISIPCLDRVSKNADNSNPSINLSSEEKSNVRAVLSHPKKTPASTSYFFTEANSKTEQDEASYTTTLPYKISVLS